MDNYCGFIEVWRSKNNILMIDEIRPMMDFVYALNVTEKLGGNSIAVFKIKLK